MLSQGEGENSSVRQLLPLNSHLKNPSYIIASLCHESATDEEEDSQLYLRVFEVGIERKKLRNGGVFPFPLKRRQSVFYLSICLQRFTNPPPCRFILNIVLLNRDVQLFFNRT
jgi:hypothetical protein